LLQPWLAKGYRIAALKIDHVVHWKKEGAETSVHVVLPQVELRR
jgi:hypothetical protein